MKDPIIKIKLLFALLISYGGLQAQNNAQPTIKAGNEFLKISSVNSASTLQRGDVAFSINSASSIQKTYKINEVNDNGFSVTMVTDKITDTISSDDSKFYFDSEKPLNSNDKLAAALHFRIGKPTLFNVFNDGVIAAVDENAPILASDTLFSFTGIEEDGLAVGERFTLIADISSYNKLKSGDSWADSSSNGVDKTVNKFWVIATTPTATTLGYSGTIRGGSLNSNITGTYVIDTSTGIVAHRIVQSVSVGYQRYNQTVYSATRRTNITESCYAMQ